MNNLYLSPTYMQDLDHLIESSSFLDNFSGKTVFITGASGLIGSAIADLLLRYSEHHDGSVTILAAGRDPSAIRQRFSYYVDAPYFHFIPYDASLPNTFSFQADYLIHGASNASPSKIQAHPIETMLDNFHGIKELLDYSVSHPVKNTVFISSSEVYGTHDSAESFQENDYGFIDLLNPRSSYSVGKRAAETLCASYAAEKGLPVSIVRPGHIYGPTAVRSDNRVSSDFAYRACLGEPLILKSDGSQIRSYCYTFDCATAILYVLLYGSSATAYNISNPDSILSIRELAGLYASFGNVPLSFELPTHEEKAAFNPMPNSSLDSTKLLQLGWTPFFTATTGTEHTIQILRESGISRS